MSFAHDAICNVIHTAELACGHCDHEWVPSANGTHNVCRPCGSITERVRTPEPLASRNTLWVAALFPGDRLVFGGVEYALNSITLECDTLRLELRRAA